MTSPNLTELPFNQTCEICGAAPGEKCKPECPAGGNLAQASVGQELVVNEICQWCEQPATLGTHGSHRDCFKEFKAAIQSLIKKVERLEVLALGEEPKEEDENAQY